MTLYFMGYASNELKSNTGKESNSLVEDINEAKRAVMIFLERRYLNIDRFFDCYYIR